ncbi:MAG: hypothetical protein ACJ789_01365 [Thermomicrobiales bacterium]
MNDQQLESGVARSRAERGGMRPLVAWLLISALVLGFFIGRVAGSGPAASAAATEPDATATRTAELAELERLRTQVAQQPTACANNLTPAVTPTLVPPAEMGQPHPYGDAWTLVVRDAEPAVPRGDTMPSGVFLQVNLTLTNNTQKSKVMLFADLVLVDGQGRAYLFAEQASRSILGDTYQFIIEPSLSVDTAIIFDVAPDAGTSFVLQSAKDPTFRVKVEVIQRG